MRRQEPLLRSARSSARSAPAAPYGFSGFRIHGPINRADYLDEYVVFQGASYFRAVGRGQVYGLSARGLAINTARPGGEEFPIFRAFWIEKPKPGARTDHRCTRCSTAQSTTGAYRFDDRAGRDDGHGRRGDALSAPRADARRPRRRSPACSCTGPAHHRIDDDFRPAVHDSDGLAIYNGNGECLWRPLTNPRTLQTSAFMDRSPKGFGLCQRARSFRDYEDLEARYERRPTVWIEPKGAWGPGYVELIEIPTDEEIHDNIVAYWKPANGPEPGSAFAFAYRMHWTRRHSGRLERRARRRDPGRQRARSRARRCSSSISTGPPSPAAQACRSPPSRPAPARVANVTVHPNPEIDGVRVSFELDPAEPTCANCVWF